MNALYLGGVLYLAIGFYLAQPCSKHIVRECRDRPDLAHKFIGLSLFVLLLWPGMFIDMSRDGSGGDWVWKAGYAAAGAVVGSAVVLAVAAEVLR